MKHVDQENVHSKNTPGPTKSSGPPDRPVRQMQQGLFHVWTFLWHALRLMIRKMSRKRVPQVNQMSEVECGLACLAMILSYYGRKTSISELRTHYAVGRDGLSALGIVRVGRHYGMRVRAISLQQNDFRFVKLPAIVHWEFNHFVVVERWSRKRVDVVDPARGRCRLTHEEFDAAFTGVVITLEPGATFDRQAAPSRRAFRTYVRQYIQQAPATVLQVLGASLLLLLIGLTLPLLTKVVVDQILPFRMENVMPVLGIGILMLFLSQTVATLLREWLLVYLRARIDIHMMLGFVEHLLTLPYSFFQQRSSGDLLTRLASNTILRDILSNELLSTLLDSSLVIFYLVILLWQSLPFGLLTLAIGLLQVLLLLASNRPIRNLASRELAAYGKVQGYLAEALAGIATLKGSGAEQRAFERWSNLFFDQLNISLRHSYLSSTMTTILLALRSLAPLALLWVGATQVLNGSITLGTMVALTALAAAFFAPLASLMSSGQQLQLIGAHLERIADVMEAEPEQKGQAAQLPPPLSGHIRLEQVSFRYTPDAPEVLHHLDLMVEAGQKVAIVGPSGAGKSTLGKLLLGLYPPTEGSIYYDGIPLQRLNYQEVRQQFGVVLQEATLFSGSILSNITLNDPTIDKEQVVVAAEIAAIDGDILRMPMGYETYVSEGGSALSGGQRQRLAIARAIAHKPALLLLDEATSHLDVVTEQKVAEHLQTLACTQIIIAHRLSTIRNADVILVLDQGTIVEQGSHHELLQRGSYYARLMQQQLAEPTLEPSPTSQAEAEPAEQTSPEPIREPSTATHQPSVSDQSVIHLAEALVSEQAEARSTIISAPVQQLNQPPGRSGKPGLLFLISAALLVGITLGGLFSFIIFHSSGSASPTSTLLPKTTPQSTTGQTVTPAPSPSSIPSANLVGSYKGTMYNIPLNVTTNISLIRIQQNQGAISGYFIGSQVNGLQVNEPFRGMIDAHRHIRFAVAEYAGQVMLSFDGSMQPDGTFAGNYCSLDQQGQCAGEYGLWSVSPSPFLTTSLEHPYPMISIFFL